MKIRDSICKICEKCRLIRRQKRIVVIRSNTRQTKTVIVFLKN